MERRHFLGLSAYLAAAVAIPFLESCSTGNTDTAVAEPGLLLHILNAKSIVETGRAYLQQYPDEKTKNKLLDLLLNKETVPGPAGRQAIHAYFDKKTVEDFNNNRTVMINGWILSRTEARQCALYTLFHS
jgi:hypothetical protein